jgi:hypothetical protein
MSSPFQRAFSAKSPLKHDGDHPYVNPDGTGKGDHHENDHQTLLEPTDKLPNEGRNIVTGETQAEILDRKYGDYGQAAKNLNTYATTIAKNYPDGLYPNQMDFYNKQIDIGEANIKNNLELYEKSRDSIYKVNKPVIKQMEKKKNEKLPTIEEVVENKED